MLRQTVEAESATEAGGTAMIGYPEAELIAVHQLGDGVTELSLTPEMWGHLSRTAIGSEWRSK